MESSHDTLNSCTLEAARCLTNRDKIRLFIRLLIVALLSACGLETETPMLPDASRIPDGAPGKADMPSEPLVPDVAPDASESDEAFLCELHLDGVFCGDGWQSFFVRITNLSGGIPENGGHFFYVEPTLAPKGIRDTNCNNSSSLGSSTMVEGTWTVSVEPCRVIPEIPHHHEHLKGGCEATFEISCP